MNSQKTHYIIFQVFFVLVLFLFFTQPLSAQEVGLFTDDATAVAPFSTRCVIRGDCTPCDIAAVGIRAVSWILKISGAVVFLSFVVSGVILIASFGNSTLIDKSKSILKSSIVGILFVLFSWQIINFILFVFTNGTPEITPNKVVYIMSQPWSKISCKEIPEPPERVIPEVDEELSNLVFTMDSKQFEHAGDPLLDKIKTLDGLVPDGTLITSISDDNILAGVCVKRNGVVSGCQHATNSRHYGGAGVSNFDRRNPPTSCAIDMVATSSSGYKSLEQNVRRSGFKYVQCENSSQDKIPCDGSQGRVNHLHTDDRC